MPTNLANALAAAEALPIAERRELIELLLQGMDESLSAENDRELLVLTDAWQREIARRSAEYDAGQAETISWHEVRQRWQERKAVDG